MTAPVSRLLLPLALASLVGCLDPSDPELSVEPSAEAHAAEAAPPREAAAALATSAFTSSYACGSTFNIAGQEPTAAGTYPVFVYTIGTSETFTNASATAAVAAMASRGFVAATVAYNSGTFGSCSTIASKARCIYDSTSTTSAISRLCARAKADCSKGIVVGGFSQGAVIATLARNFDSRVQAAWGMGDGVQYSIFNLNACMANGNRALPSSRLRVVDGEKDQFIGPTASNVRSQMLSLTGLSCGTGTNCLQSNGSGWFIVTNALVGDRSADHCYMRQTGDCGGSQNALDAGWQSGTAAWELNANLDWLASFTTP